MSNTRSKRQIHFPRDLNHQLELLKLEIKTKTGKTISSNTLVVEIVRDFFEKSSRLSGFSSQEDLHSKEEDVEEESSQTRAKALNTKEDENASWRLRQIEEQGTAGNREGRLSGEA